MVAWPSMVRGIGGEGVGFLGNIRVIKIGPYNLPTTDYWVSV